MPFVPVPSGEGVVHYELDGEGPGLVLVHGAAGDADKVFGGFFGHFTDRHTVVRPNLSGSGQTTDNGGELTLELLTEQVVAATQAATDRPVDLLGFSLGAVVAAHLAGTHPQLVRKLVLVAGCAHATNPRDTLQFGLWRALADTDIELFQRLAILQGFTPAMLDILGDDGIAQSLKSPWPPGLDRQVAVSARADIRRLLPAIQAPTLVIGFSDDQVIPVQRSRDLHSAIPDSELAEIGGGHMDWLVRPNSVIELTERFLHPAGGQ